MSTTKGLTGTVIWITGFSGAGKTTLARALLPHLPEPTVLLDGDDLRDALREFACGYDCQSRKRLALTYARMAKLLADQGVNVVVATISLFNDVHAWNRENQPAYLEVWLDVPEEECRRRDPKGLYAAPASGQMVGAACGIAPELPKSPNVILSHAAAQDLDSNVQCVLRELRNLGA